MPQEVKNSYTYTKGAGSHADVLALNNALLERPDAKISDFIGYVLTTKKLWKKYPSAGLPFERCKHCSFITKGVRFISEE